MDSKKPYNKFQWAIILVMAGIGAIAAPWLLAVILLVAFIGIPLGTALIALPFAMADKKAKRLAEKWKRGGL